MRFKTNLIILIATLCLTPKKGSSQTLDFTYLESGAASGNCISNSDPDSGIQCYGLLYTPSVTGTLFSYSTSFFGDCSTTLNPFISNGTESCVMTNNTAYQEECADLSLFLLQLSGNSGNVAH